MADNFLEPVTIESAKEKHPGSSLDNDMLLIPEIAGLPFPTEARRMQCIFVALCLRGRANYSVDTAQHVISPNDVILISHGQVLSDYMFSPDFSGLGFLISPGFFSEIVKDVHEISTLFLFARYHPISQLRPDEMATFKEYFFMLKSKIDDNEHHFRRDVVRSVITTMIYDLGNTIYRIQHADYRKQPRSEKIFYDFIKLLELHFRHERRVGWYALQLGLTPKYLSETIKQVSQRTPNDWIDNYVVKELRVMLRNSTKSIKQIADEMHFPNQSFLGKYFKEHVGQSPTEYRRS